MKEMKTDEINNLRIVRCEMRWGEVACARYLGSFQKCGKGAAMPRRPSVCVCVIDSDSDSALRLVLYYI